MKKPKRIQKNIGISPERLAKLRRTTLIASAGAPTRLAGNSLTKNWSEWLILFLGESRNIE